MKTMNFKALFLTLVTLVMSVTMSAWNGTVTTPDNLPNYYSDVNQKSGSGLWSAVQTMAAEGYDGAIDYTNYQTNKDLWHAYEITDLYPADSVDKAGMIWDMYSTCVFTYQHDQDGTCTDCGSGECAVYNREHSIPKSWFGGSTSAGTPGTDMFHVVPTDKVVNGMRSNYAFGEVDMDNPGNQYYLSANGGAKLGNPKSISIDNSILGTGSVSTTCGSTPVFEPVDQYKGDFARGYMGTLLHWAGVYEKDFNSGDGALIFSATYTADGNWGLTDYGVALLLKWHRNDPVSQKEIDRNNGIQETQGNRNPFIDYPELAEYIWGNHAGEAFPLATAIATFKDEYNPETGKMDGTGGGGTGGDPTCTKLATPAVTAVASNQTITLTWESVTGASSYVVSVGLGLYTTECTEATIGAITTSGTTNTCVITGLTNGTTYTTTVYAVASDDQCNSDTDVDTATPFVLEGLSALKDAGAGSHEVILTNALVTYVKDNKIAYIQDASTGLYIYNVANLGLSAGDRINGLVSVTTTPYNGLWEATAFDYSAATINSGATVTPIAVTIADLTNIDNYNTYESVLVKISGATVTSAFSNRNATIEQDGNSLTLRDQNSSGTITATEGKTVNVTGWLSDYNGNKQFQIWYQDQIEEVNTISYTVTWSIDGTEEADAAVEAGTALTLPANPQACDNGKVFMGWTDDANFTGTDEQIAAIFTEAGNRTVDTDITYYAVFAKKTTTQASEVTTYEKVTAEPSDWSGNYLIVNEDSKKLYQGLSGTNSSASVEISSGSIAHSEAVAKCEVIIAAVDDGYSLQMNTSADNNAGKYMSGISGSNTTNYNATASANTITLEDNGDVIGIVSNTSVFRYNSGTSNGDCFKYYKSSTYSNQQPVQLYKKTVTSTPASTSYSEYTLLCGAVTPCTLSGITLNTAGVKKEFLTSETFSADGLVVTASYTGSCSEAEATVTGWTVGAPDMSTAGTQTITVSYTEDGITKLATYDITVIAPLGNLLALKDAGAGTYYVNLDDAISTYYGTVNNKNIAFIQDAASGLYVYDVATEEIFKKGNIINGVVEVTTTDYNGLIEATAFDKLSATITEGGTVTPKAVTIAELNSGDYNVYESVYIKIAGATVTSAFDSKNATISQNGSDLVLRDQNNTATITATVDDVVNVTGWLSKYVKSETTTLQLQVFEQSQIEVVPEVTYTITVTQPIGATIAADAETAAKDAVVTLSCNLSEGYQLDAWVVKTEGGDAVTVTNNQFTMPAANVTVTATVSLKKYTLTFHVAGNTYTTPQPLPYGTPFSTIIAAAMAQYNFELVNDKYVLTRADSIFTLTGWEEVAELPTIVDGEVTEFTAIISAVAQQYKLTYKVDDEVYGEVETINCGATITPREAPTKEGYTFSGWDNVPAKMPAQDVTVSGTFTINKYTVTFVVDNTTIPVENVEYGTALNVVVAGVLAQSQYELVEGQYQYEDGTNIYTFTGFVDADSQVVNWQTAIVTGSATYTLTYTTEPKNPTGWENVEQERPAIKVVENGVMYIIRDGKKYSAQGRLIE